LDIRAVAATESDVFAGTFGDGVFISPNSSINWTAADTGLTYKYINALLAKEPFLFAGTDRKGLFRSNNNGMTWASSNNGISGDQVIQLALNGGDIYVSTNLGVFRSENDGSNWTKVNIGVSNTFIPSFAFYNGNVFLACQNFDGSANVLVSSDNGLNWKDCTTGLPNVDVYSMAVAGDYLFAGTFGQGVWKRRLSELLDIMKPYNITPFIIYPNPVKNKFYVEKSLLTENSYLSILDLNGQKMMDMNITDKRTQIDISNLPSGIYFVRLITKKTVEVVKIVKE
jgi:hypothetical protein